MPENELEPQIETLFQKKKKKQFQPLAVKTKKKEKKNLNNL